jgi:hypothetical protein
MAPRLGKYTTQLGGPSLPFRGHATCIHYTFFLFMLAPNNIQSDLRAPMLLCTRNYYDFKACHMHSLHILFIHVGTNQHLKWSKFLCYFVLGTIVNTCWLQVRPQISPNKFTHKGWNSAWNINLIPSRRPTTGPLHPILASIIFDSHPKSKPGLSMLANY